MKITDITAVISRYALVKEIPLFSELGFLDLQKVVFNGQIVEYKKGEVIYRQGDAPEAFYCLVSGRLRVFSFDKDGQKRNVEFIRHGMPFGFGSLLNKQHHSQTCEVFHDAVVLKIEEKKFLSVIRTLPQLKAVLIHKLPKKVRTGAVRTVSTFENRIISIYSPCPGSGVSTYAVNLAFSLKRETHKKVIYVNVIVKPAELASVPEGVIESISKNDVAIDLLKVFFAPDDRDPVGDVRRNIAALTSSYNYIVICLPGGMDDIALKMLANSDMAHLVTLDQKEDMEKVRDIVYKLEEELREHFEQDNVCVLVNARELTGQVPVEAVNKVVDSDVYERLPRIVNSQSNLTLALDEEDIVIPSSDSAYAKAVGKVARKIGKVSVGLVLGGGAALGIAHIGVLRVFEQEKIPVDIIVGSSMGALIGSFWALGKNADEIEAFAREFENPWAALKLCDPIIPVLGFIGGGLTMRWMKSRGLAAKTFHSTNIPFKVVAYDLIQRRELVIDSGLLAIAVRKSIAIPGFFSPVFEKDKMIIDGGVLNPLPTNVLKALDIKKIIAVNVLQSPAQVTKGYIAERYRLRQMGKVSFKESPGLYVRSQLWRLFKKIFFTNIPDIIIQSLQASEYLISEQSARDAQVLIHPDLGAVKWFELYRVDELIKKGEEAARKALPAIRELVKEQ